MTRVGVNLTWIAPGRVGGSEEYLTRQLTGLPDDGRFEVTIYCSPSFTSAHPELASRFAVVETPTDRDNRALRIGLEHTWLATKLRGADIAHHGGGTMPLVGPRTTLLTVHDLQYLELPTYFSAARRRYLDRMMTWSVDRASIIATPTRFVRDTVLDAFGIEPGRVVVVPHGVPSIGRPDDEALRTVRVRYGLADRPYVVYPAITHPHKGHRSLVEMVPHLAEELLVVLVGGEGTAEAELVRRVAECGVADRIVRTGRVPAADRDTLLADAEALIFPSEYEGFGAPLVEAMELDVPVVCSAIAACREVVGDAGVVVDVAPSDPGVGAAWAAGVAEARRRRDEFVTLGRLRRQSFTLAGSGEALAEAYRRVIEGAA